jgi:DNA polymerase III sliding clamp (beta) subunit (PCNA family)
MFTSLQFVRGAIATKDFVPVLRHFYIAGGKIQGSDGKMTLCAPIEGIPDCCPDGATFIKAINACHVSTPPVMKLTPTGRLSIKSGKFTALIHSVPIGDYYLVEPEGDKHALASGLLDAIKALRPFVGNDATRQWSTGILFRDGHMYATNNIMLVEAAHATNLPTLCLPASVLDELIRIGEDPVEFSATETTVTFFLSGERWVKSQLLPIDWPDVKGMLDTAPSASEPVAPGFFEALQTLRPFVEENGAVDLVGTCLKVGAEDGGAEVDLNSELPAGRYHIDQLNLARGSEAIDLSNYPAPVSFKSPLLRGLMMGMRR